jgi:hypothetical protein
MPCDLLETVAAFGRTPTKHEKNNSQQQVVIPAKAGIPGSEGLGLLGCRIEPGMTT